MRGGMEQRDAFAAELRRLRADAGLSLAGLAQHAHVNRGYLGHVEHGQRWPSRPVAAALDRALAADGRLLAAWAAADAATPPARQPEQADDALSLPLGEWTASDASQLADRLAGGEIALTAAAGRRLVHEWLVADTPQTVEITAGRRIGAGMVDTVTRRVAQLRRVDDHIGGRELRPLVERELRATAGLLRHAAYTDPVGRALLGAVAELCQLAGWVLADAAAPDAAARYHLLGVHAAHAAGDRSTAANLVSTLAYQVANIGDPREAVLLARSAQSGARPHASATMRALLAERVAWAHARAGETRHTERALALVETEYDQRRPADDPSWVYWLDPDEITVMAGRCYVELGHPDRAIPLLSGVLERYDERQARESALYTSWLAEAHLQAGDVDQAAHLAGRTLDLSSSTSSSRGDDRVALLRSRLDPYAAVPAVGTFLDRCATAP